MNLPLNSDYIKLDTNKWPAIIILVIFSLSIITGGVMFYKIQKKRIVEDKKYELNGIINLKIDELSKWRAERFRDLKILAENTTLRKIISDFLAGKLSPLNIKDIFLPLTENYDYQSIFIADSDNIIRFSTSEKEANLIFHPDGAYNTEAPDLHFDQDSSGIYIDLSIKIPYSGGKAAGTLVLRIDPEAELYPLIQSWPAPSKSSETLLLRKEGDSILYLNELRHVKNTALRLRLSASDSLLPAARAVSGYEGFFEGIDYRGVPVVSYLGKVPDSPWYVVAKVDKDEIYSPLNEQILLISIIVALSIITFSIIIIIYFRNQRIKYLNEISKTKDKLYSIITHDLKNPFVSIMGFSELLYEKTRKNDFSRINEFASIIYGSSANAIELLNNLTSWTKLQTGRTIFNPRETDLLPIIKEVTDSCRSAAIMKSITIKVSAPAELILKIDRVLIATIIRNLLMNAIKFSYQHSDILILVARDNSLVEVTVQDYGIGIGKQTIDRILNKDNYESMPGTANEKGTGLGLYLSMEFIKMHNGTLKIESEPGSGSKFSVLIDTRTP